MLIATQVSAITYAYILFIILCHSFVYNSFVAAAAAAALPGEVVKRKWLHSTIFSVNQRGISVIKSVCVCMCVERFPKNANFQWDIH